MIATFRLVYNGNPNTRRPISEQLDIFAYMVRERFLGYCREGEGFFLEDFSTEELPEEELPEMTDAEVDALFKSLEEFPEEDL